jgi:hypothetical protein
MRWDGRCMEFGSCSCKAIMKEVKSMENYLKRLESKNNDTRTIQSPIRNG